MPGSVENAIATVVMPQSLCTSFERLQEYPALINRYRNGESQRSVQATNSRKRWRITKRLSPSALQSLREFYEARKGPHQEFLFYDPYETSPKFTHDPTGVASAGRYVVRFHTEWVQTSWPGRVETSIELLELA